MRPRTFLLVAITLMVVGLIVVLGISFTKEKADVAKALLLFGVALVAALMGYAVAVCDRHEIIAKVGKRELRLQLTEPSDDRLGPDLEAELHDFACHVLRHREVPEWRKALVSASLPKQELPAAPQPTAPSPAARATAPPTSPPAPRAAAVKCEQCGTTEGVTPVRIPGTQLTYHFCPTHAADYVKHDSLQPA